MAEIENKFLDTMKWYAVGCFATFLVYYLMEFFKMDIHSIATCFQISCGIFFGAMLQMRARLLDKN